MKQPTRDSSIEKDICRLVQAQFKNAESKRFTVKNPIFIAKCFELDVFIPELNKGIEFDGKYWHSEKMLQKRFPNWSKEHVGNYHGLKDSFFASLGVEVLHIKEENWLKNKKAEISKILTFIGGYNG
jgi:hypothetical protein